MANWMIGIDTGGTFTDLIAFETESRKMFVTKVPSAPADPSSAVMDAVGEFLNDGTAPAAVGFLAHGTTVATNAILEGKGVRTGLLITKGFRAIYEARGWTRPENHELIDTNYQKPPMLAPQYLTEEIEERVNADGEIEIPLNDSDVRAATARLVAKGVESLAICYLFGFANAAHEERSAEIIAEIAPELRLSVASRIYPVVREYPRLSTTVLDAYVGPTISRYLSTLHDRLTEDGIKTPQVYLMQSNGGLMRMTMAANFPNQTLLSGPAAGVVSGLALGRSAGVANLVTFDMGGTSADMSVIVDGEAQETNQGKIGGQDLGTPMLEMRTIGAGGGTVAWIGRDGLLKVGPRSAGAEPGPACYGRGGTEPTITDANLVLGVLGAGGALAGRLALDRDRAAAAIREKVAAPLGLDMVEAAAGIIRIIDTHMAVNLRLAIQERGQDPRRFALAAFGGAGPLHAGGLAKALRIPKVLVPLYPGIACAMGLLQTRVKHFYLQSLVGFLGPFPTDRMNAIYARLTERALADARAEGFDPAVVEIKRQADLRYLYQGYQLTVDCPDGEIGEAHKRRLKADFDALHHRVYGQSAPGEEAELVTFRVVAEITVPQLELAPIAAGDGDVGRALKSTREVYDQDSGGFATAQIYDRAGLRAGDRIDGPAIVEQFDSTTRVLAGQQLTVDDYGTLVIALESDGSGET